MLKNILLKCAELVNRDDIINSLKNNNNLNDISNETILNDITRLISYYNFTTRNVFENYIKLTEVENLTSDENNCIYYTNFKYKPIKILSVNNLSNGFTNYNIQSTHISTYCANAEYIITYNYTPNELSDLCDSLNLPYFFNQKIICYGIISEFLASKDQYDQSEFWNNKFLYEIFKTKIKKERRIKSTFKK